MAPSLTPSDWQRRFEQQARWTRDLRAHLYPQAGLAQARDILDMGCGTGALLEELTAQSEANVFGLDLRYQHLELALGNQDALLSQGDAHQLPYPEDSFQISLCHFTLLWVRDPAAVLKEMLRVTKPGGSVLALAEPDYGGRIDYPPELERLGAWQTTSLERQGADPLMGRKLAGLFARAGLDNITSGVLGGQWSGDFSADEAQLEWAVLESDLETDLIDLESLKSVWKSHERVLYVPTFYAIGRVVGYSSTSK
jgi:SAM-dependent methyltransferase